MVLWCCFEYMDWRGEKPHWRTYTNHICIIHMYEHIYATYMRIKNNIYIYIYHLPQLIQRSSHLYVGVAPHNLTCITHPQKNIHSASIWQYESTMTDDGSGFWSCPPHLHKTIRTWKGKWTGVRAARRFPNLITSTKLHVWKTIALWSSGREIFWKHGRCCASSQTKVTQQASQAWLHINPHGAFVRDVLPKSWCHA